MVAGGSPSRSTVTDTVQSPGPRMVSTATVQPSGPRVTGYTAWVPSGPRSINDTPVTCRTVSTFGTIALR